RREGEVVRADARRLDAQEDTLRTHRVQHRRQILGWGAQRLVDLFDRLGESRGEQDIPPEVFVVLVIDPRSTERGTKMALVASGREDRRRRLGRNHEDVPAHRGDADRALGTDHAFDRGTFEQPRDAREERERAGWIVAAHPDNRVEAVLDASAGAIEALTSPAEPARALE